MTKHPILTISLALSMGLCVADNVWSAQAQPHKAHKSPNTHSGHSAQSPAMRAGLAAYQKGYIIKAIPFFETAMRQNPKDTSAKLWLAHCYRRQGSPTDYAKAAKLYRQTLALAPNSAEALSNLGEYLSWNPETRVESIEMLRKAHQLSPSHVEIDRQLSEALLWNNQAAEAYTFSKRVKATDMKWVGEKAEMLGASGHLDDAIALHRGILQKEDQKNPQSKINLARALFNANRKEEAQGMFNQVVASENQKGSKRQPLITEQLSELAYVMGMPEVSLKMDQALPGYSLRKTDVQLRHARTLAQTNHPAESIDSWNNLYEAQLLTAEQKLEFADYLRGLNLPSSVLPNPNLLESLYKEAGQEPSESANAALNLARKFAQSDVLADTQGEHFRETITAYKQALASDNPAIQTTARHELLDYIKSDKTHPADVEATFKELSTSFPESLDVKTAYAEYVSWQPDRRAEALRLYIDLAQNTASDDAENKLLWQSRLDEVLKWHRPTISLMPMYQQIQSLYPQDTQVLAAIARAYRNDPAPDSYHKAIQAYEALYKADPENDTAKKEWMALLASKPGERKTNIKYLRNLLAQTPSGQEADPDLKATYGKLLSYDHQYGDALEALNAVLKTHPKHREALLSKGYTVLWSGRKLAAKKYFSDLHQQYPDDKDITTGLAQTDKMLGRYDLAMHLMEDIHSSISPDDSSPENNINPATTMPSNGASQPVNQPSMTQPQSAKPGKKGQAISNSFGSFKPVIYMVRVADNTPEPVLEPVIQPEDMQRLEQSNAPWQNNESEQNTKDEEKELSPRLTPLSKSTPTQQPVVVKQPAQTSKLPPPSGKQSQTPIVQGQVKKQIIAKASSKIDPVKAKEMEDLKAQLEALQGAISGIKMLQASSKEQIQHLSENVYDRRVASTETSLTGDENSATNLLIGESGIAPVYGTYSAIDYDTNPILSGVGRFKNYDVNDLEKTLSHDLRPMVRAGYEFFRQGGNNTTNRMSGYGFPNQISMSLTPQLRLRGGVQPMRWNLPHGVSPSATWANQYGLGATYKPTDRLTLDSDIAITHFLQSHSSNVTFQSQVQYDFTDAISAKIGVRRIPQYNSLLTLTGLRPSQGAYAGTLLGQARENGIYGELNTHPFNPNWDWNLGYEWAFVDGSHIPTNYKNQIFTSLGHTWHFGENQQFRLGYEGLYFGYAKNATNGYFDTTSQGFRGPVVSLNPAIAANSATVFGGYYSPHSFLMNAGRVDWRGNLFNKFLEYKLGGSLGIQTASFGHGVTGSGARTTALASSFDGNVILNFTDWLAAYGDVAYLNAGGQFNRWRFGGGLMMRPKLNAISPVFGGYSHHENTKNKKAKNSSKGQSQAQTAPTSNSADASPTAQSSSPIENNTLTQSNTEPEQAGQAVTLEEDSKPIIPPADAQE